MLPRNGIRRGRPVSLFGPSSDDQREAQDGCQNGQQRLAARCEQVEIMPRSSERAPHVVAHTVVGDCQFPGVVAGRLRSCGP